MPESIYTINTFGFPNSLEVLPLEINLRNSKILASLDQLYNALSFYSTTHDHLPNRQYYSGHLLIAALKFYLKRRNCHAYIFLARYLFLPFLHDFIYIYIFSVRAFFQIHWRFIGQQGKGGDHLLFHSTNSAHSRTFRYLFATLHVRWLSHIFNCTSCIYKSATRWDLPPYWQMMQCLLFIWWCDYRFSVKAIWHG